MLTANSTLDVRRGTSGAWTALGDVPAGTAAWAFNDTNRTRPIPSIPDVLAIQKLRVKDGSVTITIDDNERTHPLFFLRSGEVFQFRIRRAGIGSGNPEAVITGPATINGTNTEGGARGFQVTLTATAVERSAQS